MEFTFFGSTFFDAIGAGGWERKEKYVFAGTFVPAMFVYGDYRERQESCRRKLRSMISVYAYFLVTEYRTAMCRIQALLLI